MALGKLSVNKRDSLALIELVVFLVEVGNKRNGKIIIFQMVVL